MNTHPSPSSGPRRERRKESRPAELLVAALELFVERGFAATRLDEVAARAGVSKGTLYLYYASKEELFTAVVRETIVPRIEAFRREVEQSDLPAPELLERTLRGWWAAAGETPLGGIAKLMVAEAGNFPEVARLFNDEVIVPEHAILAGILTRGIEAGEFVPVDLPSAIHLCLSPLVLKAIWAHSFEAPCLGAQRLDPRTYLDAHCAFVRRALCVPRPLLDPPPARGRSPRKSRA